MATSGYWYEVMLSPFKNKKEIKEYYEKYSKYYSLEERVYRVTNTETGYQKLLK